MKDLAPVFRLLLAAVLTASVTIVPARAETASDATRLVPVAFTPKPIPPWRQLFHVPQKFAIYCPDGVPIHLDIVNSGKIRDGELRLSDSAGNSISSHHIPPGETALKLLVPSPGVYFVEYENHKQHWRISIPEAVSAVLCLEAGKPMGLNGGLLRRYFYVPRGTKEIQLTAETKAPKYKLHVLNPDGQIEKSFDENEPPAPLAVPDGMDGKVWSFDGTRFAASLLSFENLPNFLAASPNGLLLPKALVEKDGL